MGTRFQFDDRTAVVETTKGKVRGYILKDIYVFKGIPYAKAKRFHAPEPVPAWMMCSTPQALAMYARSCICPGQMGKYSYRTVIGR